MGVYDNVDDRLQAIEREINNLQKVVNNLASSQQLRQLLALRQQDITDLQNRVAALETQVAILQRS